MKRTDVFATKEECEELQKILVEAENTPVVAFSMAQGLAGNDLSSMAHKRVNETCHKFALQHGLPEIDGYYGCNLKTREFVTSE